MAFGQASGPPAAHKQVQQLLELLVDAGHTDFRDARGPMGFTQRQAAGKFTREEAQSFIDELEATQHADSQRAAGERLELEKPGTGPPASAPRRAERRATLSAAERTLRTMTSEQLAAELQRRGWVVLEP